MSPRSVMTPAGFGAVHAATGLRDVARLVAYIHAVHVSRRALAELEPRLLADIGMSQRQAMTETARAPWDVRPAAPQRRDRHDGGSATALRASLRAMLRRWRTRQRISGLDQHALRDIGVSFAEAEREANKAFWQR